ncbi:MAG: hypothetical protein CMN04_09130 [Roseibacillus sp.]|nr:hypothetical protein [Roseibacillus sp.]
MAASKGIAWTTGLIPGSISSVFRLALISLALLTSLPAAELTVASFNIRLAARGDLGTRSWKARRDLVVETIRKMDPDLFGVQEALPQQMDYLTRELPDYQKFGVGRDDGKNRGEYSAIFIRAERLTRDAEEGGTFWLSGTPAAAGSKSWGNGITRICTWTRLVDQKTGKGFYFYNTHWDHQSQPSREQAGRLMAKRIDARKRMSEPVVVTGDFNATETNPGVSYLLGKKVVLAGGKGPEQWSNPLKATFFELHPEVKDRNTFNRWKGVIPGARMIDHVLVSPGWKIQKAWIEYHMRGKMVPSDHWPVAAVIRWADQP